MLLHIIVVVSLTSGDSEV